MKKIRIRSTIKKILSDTFTPVAIYLKMREIFPQSVLLESSDYHSSEDSLSIICLQPVVTISVIDHHVEETIRDRLTKDYPLEGSFAPVFTEFMNRFSFTQKKTEAPNGFFGYLAYDAIRYFETIPLTATQRESYAIPDIRYSLYKYVITINHFNNTMFITENLFDGESSEIEKIEMFIRKMAVATGSFSVIGEERSNITDDDYLSMVKTGKRHCFRGDVFQIVLARQFEQDFQGDDFNLYRSLRSVNPSPYLFYFDYGNYRIFGSSPETHLKIINRRAYINPIAGTFKRTGNDEEDKRIASELTQDEKENAEHTMLVDLARNDLSRYGSDIRVEKFQEIQFYSHVIHMVSTVSARLDHAEDSVSMLGATFPAGTLTGAPKYKAMELIDRIENQARGFYGGAIGYLHPGGNLNHAIMIRSFLSKNNTLFYQAGAGIVSRSSEENELQEVNNKLAALKKAILMAQNI
ncbi:MAG: anthranilate synthase component I family protein [Bacteroidales bacterium]|nr:anthranilate synthase component I family protein [Bacteroidales bacterium]